jgi:hypothetical protein
MSIFVFEIQYINDYDVSSAQYFSRTYNCKLFLNIQRPMKYSMILHFRLQIHRKIFPIMIQSM